jgi:hypothetical protein
MKSVEDEIQEEMSGGEEDLQWFFVYHYIYWYVILFIFIKILMQSIFC